MISTTILYIPTSEFSLTPIIGIFLPLKLYFFLNLFLNPNRMESSVIKLGDLDIRFNQFPFDCVGPSPWCRTLYFNYKMTDSVTNVLTPHESVVIVAS